MSGFNIKHVANCFLEYDFQNGGPHISPLKIQKLVYCLHGWHLVFFGKPAINSHFRAWRYGPVEEFLYHTFKRYGGDPITDYARDWNGGENRALSVKGSVTEFYKVFDFVIKHYMPWSALQLSTMAHQRGTPWDITYRKQGENAPIANDLITKHFRSLVKQ